MPGAVVALGPLALEQRLGLPVLELLLEVVAGRAAAMVPDDRAGAEAHGPAAVLQPPADVDVVTGDPELVVEAADLLQPVLPEGHVAGWDVRGDLIRQQHVDRPAGRVRDALGDVPVAA